MTHEIDPLTDRRPTINPYLTAGGIVLGRLLWDLRVEAWRSRARLRALRNRHAGRKAVVLCNGPSLLKVDLDRLNGVYTFGLNKINLMFDRSSFRPSCIVAVNRHVIDQNADFYRGTDIPLFLDTYAHRSIPGSSERCFLHAASIPHFARDVSVSINQGYTVTFVALQLAFHMGFSDVAVVGCDHSFAAKGPANSVVTAGKTDPDHFDPNYFAGGVKWELPDLVESEHSYWLARRNYEALDRRLVNATVGGKLEVFERMELDDFLALERGGAAS